MSEYKIVDCSPQALAIRDAPKKNQAGGKYPFDSLTTGKSFVVPFAEDLNEISLRNLASRAGKRLHCKFRVVKHGEPHNCYEIARIG